MKKNLLLVLSVLFAITAFTQATWNQDIAPIVFEHCAHCHHDGGIGPFSLTSYSEAAEEADDILEHVLDGHMPPWPANPDYVHFLNENVLSEEQKSTITDWVIGGSLEGTGSQPEVPTFNDGYALVDPDEVVAIPFYEVSVMVDEYRTYVIPSTSNEDRYIGSMEVEPGNTNIVHHVLFWYDPTNASQATDDGTPEPGFLSSGGAMSSPDAVLIGGWVPGAGMISWPENLGMKIPGGADWVVEVHYAPGSEGQSAGVNMRLKFKEAEFIREVWNNSWLYHYPPSLQEAWLIIPANTTPTFHEESESSPVDLSLISVFPHMHLLGQTFKVYGLTEEGDTIRIVDVDQYEFHWQFNYTFPTLLKIPAESIVHGEATYDNTVNNEDNPNDPPQLVTLGEGTTDEMMICFFTYTYYLPGDENLSLATSMAEIENKSIPLTCWPNPANDKLSIALPGHPTGQLDVVITDALGRTTSMLNYNVLNSVLNMNVSTLAGGCYTARIASDENVYTTRFIVE
ncbi:MAG: T9SS type A sorting domain-containing protein [Flavobacteriales bacterium]|nr:T9SS type A sorting domain-containing protein [Flavobacteriales bacterium]